MASHSSGSSICYGQYRIASSAGQHILNNPAEVTVLGGVIKLLNQDPMVYCVVRSRYVHESGTCNYSDLVIVFNVFG